MTRTFSVKYFMSRLRKMRLTISKVKGYRSIDELMTAQTGEMGLSLISQKQGRENEM